MAFGDRKKKKEKVFDPLAELRSPRREDPNEPKVSSFATTKQQEEEIAAIVGGRRHPGSGSIMGLKSDASSDHYQIEAKQTKHASITLGLEWLSKITTEAIGKAKVPMMHLRFLNVSTAYGFVEKDWVVLPQSEFKRLVEGDR